MGKPAKETVSTFEAEVIKGMETTTPKTTAKQIVTENLYKYFNKLIGKYNIKRKLLK